MRLANVTAASLTYSNNLEKIETIRNDGKVELVSTAFPNAEVFSISDIKPNPAATWANYVKGVLVQLKKRGVNFTGFNAAIHSTLPLSVSFRETINKLIAWAGSGRARMASSQQEANESAAGDQLYYSYQNGTRDGIQ